MSGRSSVVLVGAPGAGKTTVGPLVAAQLGLPFIDVDADLAAHHGAPAGQLLIRWGELAFRSIEHTTTCRLLERAGVLALGGGAIIHPGTRAALRGHRVIWLQVDPAAAARRIGPSHDRPLLAGDVSARLCMLLSHRTPLYAAVADHVVSTTDSHPDTVADAIVGALAAKSPAA